jgi:hypothetical protein
MRPSGMIPPRLLTIPRTPERLRLLAMTSPSKSASGLRRGIPARKPFVSVRACGVGCAPAESLLSAPPRSDASFPHRVARRQENRRCSSVHPLTHIARIAGPVQNGYHHDPALPTLDDSTIERIKPAQFPELDHEVLRNPVTGEERVIVVPTNIEGIQ